MNRLSPFTERQSEYLTRSVDSWFNVAEGGKRGGKNVLQTFAFCLALETHPDKLHLISGYSVANARLNIVDCDGYGLLNYFQGRCREGKYQKRDCLYVKTITGDKVILISGGGKNGDEKLIKGNSYGMAYVTEANECAPVFLKEVFDRTISSKDRKIYHDLNPKGDGHWYYRDILDFHEKQMLSIPGYGYNYGHFTLLDNMSLTMERIKIIIATYDKRSIWYHRDILGKRRQAEGIIYDMFSTEAHTYKEFSPTLKAGRRYIAVDYGTVNPCAFLDIWLSDDDMIYVMREYYYDSQTADGKKQKTDQEYGDDIETFIGSDYPDYIVIDPSAASFKAELQKRRYRVQDADNEVLDGIRRVATLFSRGKLLIHEDCANTIRELQSYSWDEKAKQRGEEKPVKSDDHAADALRYFCKTIINWRRFAA